jgi:hypothetical protein
VMASRCPGSPRREPRECGWVFVEAARIPSACASGFPARAAAAKGWCAWQRWPRRRSGAQCEGGAQAGRRDAGDGMTCRCREARGASRGNAVGFLMKRRGFPQLALRASQQGRRGERGGVRGNDGRGERGGVWDGVGTQRPQAAPRACPGSDGSPSRRSAEPPPLRGGHGRPEVRPLGRSANPWRSPRRPKPAGAMDGPAGVKFNTGPRTRRSRRG